RRFDGGDAPVKLDHIRMIVGFPQRPHDNASGRRQAQPKLPAYLHDRVFGQFIHVWTLTGRRQAHRLRAASSYRPAYSRNARISKQTMGERTLGHSVAKWGGDPGKLQAFCASLTPSGETR